MKYPKGQFKEERVYFSSQFKGAVHHSGGSLTVRTVGPGARQLVTLHLQSVDKRWKLVLTLPAICSPAQGTVPPMFVVALPT